MPSNPHGRAGRLAVMNSFSLARTAGILYLIFAIFSCAVLWVWLGGTSWQTHREQLPTVPGELELLSVIGALTAASLALGVRLTLRASVSRPLLIGGAVTALTALWW